MFGHVRYTHARVYFAMGGQPRDNWTNFVGLTGVVLCPSFEGRGATKDLFIEIDTNLLNLFIVNT